MDTSAGDTAGSDGQFVHSAPCTVDMPGYALRDIQLNARYVVYAIRSMHQRAGPRIDLVGLSQAGMVGRWALEVLARHPRGRQGLRGHQRDQPRHAGRLPGCAGGCAPPVWHQQTGSRFLAALNDGPETFAAISYIEVHTLSDETAAPNLPPAATSSLHTGDGRIASIELGNGSAEQWDRGNEQPVPSPDLAAGGAGNASATGIEDDGFRRPADSDRSR